MAGSSGRQIFDVDSYPLIYRYTGGVPRLINTLCDTAMMAAFTASRNSVTTADVTEALNELQWTEYMSRTNRIYMRNLAISPEPAHNLATTPESAPSVARILVAHGGKTVLERALQPGRLVIGRTTDNDIQIDSVFVSRHHCQIVTSADSCMIEDLNSTNGIYLQSRRVHKYNLNDGDVVRIGHHEIIYVDDRLPHYLRTATGSTAGDADAPMTAVPAKD